MTASPPAGTERTPADRVRAWRAELFPVRAANREFSAFAGVAEKTVSAWVSGQSAPPQMLENYVACERERRALLAENDRLRRLLADYAKLRTPGIPHMPAPLSVSGE